MARTDGQNRDLCPRLCRATRGLQGVSHTITNTRPDQLVDIALPFLLGGEPGDGRPE